MGKQTVETGRRERPMVTREEYEQGRALLDALPPGIYTKCTGCSNWQLAGEIHMDSNGVYCERCGSER